MKREQLTNVTTEARCNLLARDAFRKSVWIVRHPDQVNTATDRFCRTQCRDLADRIIALRTAELSNAAQVAK